MPVTPLVIGAAAALLVWFFALYVGAMVRTRSRPVPPGAPHGELGMAPEPPAVVHLVCRGWKVGPDAGEATLLDLAARGFLTLRQEDRDPATTTVAATSQAAPELGDGALLAYERRVLSRVRAAAADGPVPLGALPFRDQKEAQNWAKQLRQEIVADARSRGLSRARFSGRHRRFLLGAGGLALAALVAGAYLLGYEISTVVFIGAIGLAVLGGLARGFGERDTGAGRAVAARWLGFRDWVRAHAELPQAPPATVTYWHRHLAYAAAVGAAPVATAALDLGLGDDRRVWSRYGGRWRRVEVRYPRGRPHHGRSLPRLLGLSLWLLGFGVLTWFPLLVMADLISLPYLLLAATPGFLLVVAAAYLVIRGIVDLRQQRAVTGEVLWVKNWRVPNTIAFATPWLHHLAVDDGTADRTTAWALPNALSGMVSAGMAVRILVRPWTRLVVDVSALPVPQDAPPAGPTGSA